MTRVPVNITAFAIFLTLMFATANCYTYEQYQSIASQASNAHFDAQTELGYFNILINNAHDVGISRAPYDAKYDEILSSVADAQILMNKAEWDQSESDGYALAYSEQSSALSLSNQAKKDALAAQAAINSVLAAQIQYTVTPSQFTTTVYNGKTESVDYVIISQDQRIMDCDYSTSDGESLSIGRIYGYETGSFSAHISAPSDGSGKKTVNVIVSCSVENYATTKKTAMIQVQYGEEPTKIAMNSAQDAIDTANSQISDLESAISNAVIDNPSLDQFLGDARVDLESAKTAVAQAESSLAKATDSYYWLDKDAALTQANSALSSAQSASRLVTSGQGKITKATEAFKVEGGQAQLTINSANSAIKSAQGWLERANGIIDNATALGMDTKDQVAMVATANGLVENAQNDVQDAADQLRLSKYAEAKANAATALNNSKEAEGKAKEAYESLSSVMQVCQAAHLGILAAQSAISDADTIYTRLAAVAKNLPQEVNAKSSAQDIETQRQKLDKAKNGYSDLSFLKVG